MEYLMPHAFMPARRRGRPKFDQPSTETGTPELIFKRAHQETAEAIDVCLERNILNAEQHWCGLHLRWLHTIRFGAPGVSAFDLTRIDGYDMGIDDPKWRHARETEYQNAIKLLLASQRFDQVMSVCVYNERPLYLKRAWMQHAFGDRQMAQRIHTDITKLREGLDVLVAHWHKAH
jgi:hypothetical protein